LPFALFIGVAMSITAFPVLARIVKEKKLNGTIVGTISLSSAAIEDVTAWSLLALIIAVAKSTSIATSVMSLLLVILFIAVMILIVQPLIKKYQGLLFSPSRSDIFGITLIIALLLVSAIITDVLGVHAVFGAFIAGLIMPAEIKNASPVKIKLEDFTSVLLLPVFFALTGLKTQFGLLNSFYLWGLFALVLLVAVAGKLLGVVIAARVSKIGWRDSLVLGVLMNTRGLMELIALNIGYDLGVISGPVFTLLVLMAIITTFMTGPLLNLILRKDHLQSTHSQE
jgi:Kef-type K+ transport system membrane component KefB